MYLCELMPGESGIVCGLEESGEAIGRLRDIGVIEGTKVKALQKSPLGDPTAYLIRGAVFAIRREEGRKIQIERG